MKSNKEMFRTIQAGGLIFSNMALLGETMDSFQGNSVISTHAANLRPNAPWRTQIMEDWVIVSVHQWDAVGFRAVLDREGKVNIYGTAARLSLSQAEDKVFQIPEAGVFGEAQSGLGYVNRIRAIGDQLYICGQARQVYQFEWDGKTLESGKWRNIAGAMRQAPMSDAPEGHGEDFDKWLDENDTIDLVDIHGTSSQDIYVVGDQTWHFNGQSWRKIELPTDEPMAAITLLEGNRVVLVGHNSSVLIGNQASGFVDISSVDDNQNFVGVAWYDNQLWLASNLGLYRCDPAIKKIEKYETNLQPDLQDTHQLEAKDGVLWSFGFKDLAHFDGKVWTRIDHPDNPLIR